MKWTATRPAAPPLASFTQMQSQLRLTTTDEQIYWQDLLDACTEHAENALNSSLLVRTIVAVYYEPSNPSYQAYYRNTERRLHLPRGPVQSVSTAIDAAGITLTNYSLEREGNTDLLHVGQGFTPPLTVTYTAGYGSNMTDVPADIRMAIRTHVATLFEQRASTDEKTILPVPHSLEMFYAARRRGSPVG
jgi:uncharacterized phiE125 gp8 family phage protein